jgi:hypothetical protein
LLSSGDAGDPACNARDSGDLVAFFRTNASEIKSVSWNWQSGWNLNPQFLYGSGATGDPVAISRTLDSMDVFFGKNNGNLVHLGWTAAYGWNITDWTVGSALTGRPTAITRNGGGDMSCFYQETNGYIAERNWDWQLGWGWQDWQAQLIGAPSAVSRTSSNLAFAAATRDTASPIAHPLVLLFSSFQFRTDLQTRPSPPPTFLERNLRWSQHSAWNIFRSSLRWQPPAGLSGIIPGWA